MKHWGVKTKKTMAYHPPANGIIERFNKNLKMVILATYAAGQDLEEEVEKYVSAYCKTPHSVTGEKPNKLMFNREVSMKLPRIPTTPQAKNHRVARQNDAEAKRIQKQRYDKKHRAQLLHFKIGDLAYRKNRTPSTTRGP